MFDPTVPSANNHKLCEHTSCMGYSSYVGYY